MSEPEKWRDEVEITLTPCEECKGWSREWRLVGSGELLKSQRNHLRTCSTNALFRLESTDD